MKPLKEEIVKLDIGAHLLEECGAMPLRSTIITQRENLLFS